MDETLTFKYWASAYFSGGIFISFLSQIEIVHQFTIKYEPLVSINQVSGTEVTRRAIAAHEDSKRRLKSDQPKAILQGS